MKLKLVLAMGLIAISLTACNSNVTVENTDKIAEVEEIENDTCNELNKDKFKETTDKPVIYLYPEESETCTESELSDADKRALEEFSEVTQGMGKPII